MEEPTQTLESRVLNIMIGAFKSREVMEAGWPADAPPLDDDRVLLNNWTALAHRQGSILAHLAIVGPTRADLMARMPGVVDRVPAWLDARLKGEPMTWRIFMTGLAQIAVVHREAIEQVVSEQVSDPEPIAEALAEAPIPAATPDEDRSALMRGVIMALSAHTKALAGIAYDLEVTVGQWSEGNEDWDDSEQ